MLNEKYVKINSHDSSESSVSSSTITESIGIFHQNSHEVSPNRFSCSVESRLEYERDISMDNWLEIQFLMYDFGKRDLTLLDVVKTECTYVPSFI
jgi:hypothetical protein